MSRIYALLLLAFASGVFAQALEFEVATVKPVVDPPRIPAGLPVELKFSLPAVIPEQVSYRNVTLQELLAWAYGLKLDQVRGPGWIGSDRFDVQGKVPAGTTQEQVRQMLQALLAERFRVRFHREQKNTAVYELVVAKGGPKLQAAAEPAQIADTAERRVALEAVGRELADRMAKRSAQGSLRGFSSFTLTRATMAQFISSLASNVDPPIVDKTQIEGLHAFSLEWVRSDLNPRGELATGPSIFTALEDQLGLSLKSVNENYESIVVDAAERMPDAN